MFSTMRSKFVIVITVVASMLLLTQVVGAQDDETQPDVVRPRDVIEQCRTLSEGDREAFLTCVRERLDQMEDVIDRREDILDRLEDFVDRHEDWYDRLEDRRDDTPGDREDRFDRREDRRDRRENQFDRREDRRDRREDRRDNRRETSPPVTDGV